VIQISALDTDSDPSLSLFGMVHIGMCPSGVFWMVQKTWNLSNVYQVIQRLIIRNTSVRRGRSPPSDIGPIISERLGERRWLHHNSNGGLNHPGHHPLEWAARDSVHPAIADDRYKVFIDNGFPTFSFSGRNLTFEWKAESPSIGSHESGERKHQKNAEIGDRDI
jgi:hypothetical protein